MKNPKKVKAYYCEKFCGDCGASVGLKRCSSHTYLCDACRKARRKSRQTVVKTRCKYCGWPIECKGRKPNYKSLAAGRSGAAYCSEECRDKFVAWNKKHLSGPKIAAFSKKHSPSRMKKDNPMFKKEIRRKMADTLKRIGHGPKIRGGNGRPMPVPQKKLLHALGAGWEPECVVPLGRRVDGYPTNYKIDIGNRSLMIGIEVDGGSHYSIKRREQDLKKDIKLRSLGWDILRFKNNEVNENINMVLSKIKKMVGASR